MADIKDQKDIDVSEVYGKAENFFEENKQVLTYVLVGIVGIFAIIFGYKKLYQEPRIQEAAEYIWKAEYYFQVDSFNLALNGDAKNNSGFLAIIDDYSGTPSANLASYYTGIIYLKQGEYELAIDYLKDADFSDDMLGAVAKGSIGDAYVELGDLEEGISYFKKAANHSANSFSAPIYLKKAGIAYETLNDYSNALEMYERIAREFPESEEAKEIEKSIAYVKSFVN